MHVANDLPNSPKFSFTKHSCYTVVNVFVVFSTYVSVIWLRITIVTISSLEQVVRAYMGTKTDNVMGYLGV